MQMRLALSVEFATSLPRQCSACNDIFAAGMERCWHSGGNQDENLLNSLLVLNVAEDIQRLWAGELREG